ncbi:Eukaryotic translation initiation factor 2A [Porphyridium purpureum]|uniref:Eukaryotic translation initiation factor 2A n=1 Tax=Porphyridium purpureum TaxID=35688 RepID=A0A5J4YU43_PORPP|nr:Eukaryotic translation initiation factor 2A [Porphyridium purpureum]|eukprot:POR3300..scf227_4
MGEAERVESESAPVPSAPPVRVLIRTSNEGHVGELHVPPRGEPQDAQHGQLARRNALPTQYLQVQFAADGSRMVCVEEEPVAYVIVRDAATGAELSRFAPATPGDPLTRASQVALSPRGSYVLVWAKTSTDPRGNLAVFDATTGQKIAAFAQKSLTADLWPCIQWSDDESVAVRASANTVFLYEENKFAETPAKKYNVPGVERVALSPGSVPYRLGAFVPAIRDQPSKLMLIDCDSGETLVTRSTFRAESTAFLWAPSGKALLAIISTNVDTSGKSYYGESALFYMDVAKRTDTRVQLPKDGPIHDIAWAPDGRGFIAVYGYMPARTTLFNALCEPIFDFGSGSRNTVSFSPHGRIVALCGFGNLPGHVEFWDKKARALIGEADMHCTTEYSWSPCSRYFLAATTFPRLRVDNCVSVFKSNGELVYKEKMDSGKYVHQARFVPAPTHLFPDLPASPRSGAAVRIVDGKKVVDLSKVTSATPVAERKVYRPPGARGQAASFSLHEKEEARVIVGGKFGPSSGSDARANRGPSRVVPGAEGFFDDDSSAAGGGQKKKRSKSRNKKTTPAETGSTAPASSASANRTGNDAKKAEPESGEADASVHPEPASAADEPEEVSKEKRIKALKKKLRQIETLELVTDKSSLNEEQVAKLQSKLALLEELRALE